MEIVKYRKISKFPKVTVPINNKVIIKNNNKPRVITNSNPKPGNNTFILD